MIKRLVVTCLLLALAIPAGAQSNRVYLPVILSGIHSITAQTAYGDIQDYLDLRLTEARQQRQSKQPNRQDLIDLLRVPPECLTGQPAKLIQVTPYAIVDGVVIEQWRLSVCQDRLSYYALVGKTGTAKQPLVIAYHGTRGRPEKIFGLDGDDIYHAFGLKLAKAGYTVFAPVVVTQPIDPATGSANLLRNELDQRASSLGTRLLGIELGQAVSAIDYLQTRGDVTGVATYGISLGGALSFYSGAVDERIAVTVVSQYAEDREEKLAGREFPYAYWRYEDADYIIIQDWLLYYDDLSVARLIAPRALFIESGKRDSRHPAMVRLLPAFETLFPPGSFGFDDSLEGHEIMYEGAKGFMDGRMK